MCKGHCWKSCDSADKRAKYAARRDIYWQSCVCVCVFWLEGAKAHRQCEVEVRPRRHSCGVVTCALTHASCSSPAPEDLLTVMSFDSCHLWVSSRSYDMDSIFFYFFFYHLLFERGWPSSPQVKKGERGLWGDFPGRINTTENKTKVC